MVGYGYRLFWKVSAHDERQDCHSGAYGFSREDEALNDAKRRIEESGKDKTYYWSIETYSYELEEDTDPGRIKAVAEGNSCRIIQFNKKRYLNET